MRLIDFLFLVAPDTIVSIQFHEDDRESYCELKEALRFTIEEVRPFRVKTFYPEHFKSLSCMGITAIVEEVE